MKKTLLVSALVLVILGAAAGAFAAIITPTVTVTATVQSQCGQAVNGVMAFDINPASGSDILAAVTTPATVKCTNGRLVTVSAASSNAGSNSATGTLVGSLVNGGNSIPYTFTFNNGLTGQGFGGGKDVSVNINGTVLATDAAQAVYLTSGNYSDTVTLTITY
jgi:spore coat protein U-like protein